MQIIANINHPSGMQVKETFRDLFSLSQRLRSMPDDLHGRTFLEGCGENETRHLFALLSGDGKVVHYAQPRLSKDMRKVQEGWTGRFGRPVKGESLWLTH